MDINLSLLLLFTSLGGGAHFLGHLLNIHTKFIRSILRKNDPHRRLKKKIPLDMCKNGWALHYVVINCMQTAYGYAIHNNKGDQTSSIAAIWAIYHHVIIGQPEESVESQHSYCPNDDKTWCKVEGL